MNCDKCGYSMSSFDTECPRCHGKGATAPVTAQTVRPQAVLPPNLNSTVSTASSNAPPPLPNDWHYTNDHGQQVGPVSDAHIRQLIKTGTINGNTLLWRPGLTSWQPAHMTDFAQVFPPPVPATMGAARQTTTTTADESSVGLWLLGFFFPIIGFIVWLVLTGKTPRRAGSAGYGALWGFLLGMVVFWILTIMGNKLENTFSVSTNSVY